MANYFPINAAQTVQGIGSPPADRWAQNAGETFKQGAPLFLVGGYAGEWDAGADDILGFALEEGQNLDSDGVAKEISQGTPPNWTSAIKTPIGARPSDGKVGYLKAVPGAIFYAPLLDGQTFSQALLIEDTYYTLEKDGTTGLWYVDPTETAGNDAIVRILGPYEVYRDSTDSSLYTAVLFTINPERTYWGA